MALEKPEYEVLYQDDNFEYRKYSSYVVAETEVTDIASYNDAANEGFMRLFRYITGNNSGRQDIAMTAPVQQTPVGEKIAMTAPVQQTPAADGWRIAFMVPSEYELAAVPVPADPRIHIRVVPERVMAVVRYSGRWTQRNVDKHEAMLRERLAADGVVPVSAVETAFYNAPYTPPFLRRNEVMVEVKSPELAAGMISLHRP